MTRLRLQRLLRVRRLLQLRLGPRRALLLLLLGARRLLRQPLLLRERLLLRPLVRLRGGGERVRSLQGSRSSLRVSRRRERARWAKHLN